MRSWKDPQGPHALENLHSLVLEIPDAREIPRDPGVDNALTFGNSLISVQIVELMQR